MFLEETCEERERGFDGEGEGIGGRRNERGSGVFIKKGIFQERYGGARE